MTFGQSFQVTPVQMAATVSSLINGGKRVTPHFGVEVLDSESGKTLKTFSDKQGRRVISEKTSETMRKILESVVSVGSGKNAYIEGYSIGGKTATSQTLPRSANKYISSFIGFAPAENPQILGMCVIYDPKGIYYGGTIAAPVVREILMTYCRTLASKNKRTQSLKRKSDRDRKEEQPAAEEERAMAVDLH